MHQLAGATLLFSFPALAHSADAPPFSSVQLRLFEQADDGVLPVTRRIYATHFDATRMRWLGVEVAATYAAPRENALVPLECAMQRPDGTRVPTSRDMSFQLFAGETESSSANVLWGVEDEDDWPPGGYQVECSAAGQRVGQAAFEVVRGATDVAGADIHVAEMRFFPVVSELPAKNTRAYTRRFPVAETRRIGVELEFTHEPIGRVAKVPIACYFFWPDGQTSPPLSLSYEPEATWPGGYAAGGMGWDEPGQWPRGIYTTVCMIYGRPVA
ncbi:MAG: hypothetical protein ACT4UQ_04710, partial [Gammaproteobacteria bacterium]